MSEQPYEKPMLEYVTEKLLTQRGKWMDISRETGVAYHTLTKIAHQKNRDFGVKKIQAIHDFFKSQEEQDAA